MNRRGKGRYISAVADEATRTFRIELEIPNPSRRVMQGISSEMHLPLAPVAAHLISPAILTLADDGTVGVTLVNDEDPVEFHPVPITGDGPEEIGRAPCRERVCQ